MHGKPNERTDHHFNRSHFVTSISNSFQAFPDCEVIAGSCSRSLAVMIDVGTDGSEQTSISLFVVLFPPWGKLFRAICMGI